MKMRIAMLALVMTFSLPAFAVASPQPSPNDPTSGELVEQSKRWDGKTIEFTGEVITEAQERGEFAWIHINDDAYYLKNVEEGAPLGGYNSGHAIWIKRTEAEKVTYWGDHANEGDVVTVRGTFNAACGEHGGDMDIHGDSLSVDIVGHPAEDPIRPWKATLAVVSVIAAGIAWGLNRKESLF